MNNLIDSLSQVLDKSGVLKGNQIGDRYLGKSTNFGSNRNPYCVVRPTSTDQVSNVIKICNDMGVCVVPQGGMTGLVGGGVVSQDEIVLSLERMNKINEIDPIDQFIVAESGVVLEEASSYALKHNCIIPVDLGARGSATLGGLISTNAGGNRVIRYGMTRHSVLGLEAVLADGSVLSSMNRMLKNNAGYDLKQLFIGSEGTLGVITKCILRLYPQPRTVSTAFIGLKGFDEVKEFLYFLNQEFPGGVGAFEVMWSDYYKAVEKYCPLIQIPLPSNYDFYVLTELLGSNIQLDQESFISVLDKASKKGLIDDAVIAQSDSHKEALWSVREGAYEVFRKISPMFTYDVSMPIAAMEKFSQGIKSELSKLFPDSTSLIFGHMGDSNLHVVVSVGRDSQEVHDKVNDIIYGAVRDLNGSISGEHGIGLEKRDYLSWCRSSEEIDMMKKLKLTLDPKRILNPGKIFL